MTYAMPPDAERVVEIRKLWTVFKSPDGDQVVHRDLDLTIVRGEVLSLVGGMVASDAALDLSPAYFLSALPRAVPMSNLYLALSKSAVFGILIALIGCHFGLRVEPNTQSLGQGTTASVVTAITVVILVDALFAVLFKGVGLR